MNGYIDEVKISRDLRYKKILYECKIKFLFLFVLSKYSGYQFSSLDDAIRSEEYILNRIKPKCVRSLCKVVWVEVSP